MLDTLFSLVVIGGLVAAALYVLRADRGMYAPRRPGEPEIADLGAALRAYARVYAPEPPCSVRIIARPFDWSLDGDH